MLPAAKMGWIWQYLPNEAVMWGVDEFLGEFYSVSNSYCQSYDLLFDVNSLSKTLIFIFFF